MTTDRKTTEALRPVGGREAGKDFVGKTPSGIFYAKGPNFHQTFMASYIMPLRRGVAELVVASFVQRHGLPEDIATLCDTAWEIADQFALRERETLDAHLGDYWNLYMQQNKSTDEVMDAVIDAAQDWSV